MFYSFRVSIKKRAWSDSESPFKCQHCMLTGLNARTQFLRHQDQTVPIGALMSFSWKYRLSWSVVDERGGPAVECLTRDQGVADSSLTGSTALCIWARRSMLCLVLVQPMKTRPDIIEIQNDWDIKNQIKTNYTCCIYSSALRTKFLS